MTLKKKAQRLVLSNQEIELINSASKSYQRRSNFERIFPSPHSWKKYSNFFAARKHYYENCLLHYQQYPKTNENFEHVLSILNMFPHARRNCTKVSHLNAQAAAATKKNQQDDVDDNLSSGKKEKDDLKSRLKRYQTSLKSMAQTDIWLCT